MKKLLITVLSGFWTFSIDLLLFTKYSLRFNIQFPFSVRLNQLDLEHKTCKFVNLTYSDPHYPNVTRNALVIRGPSKVRVVLFKIINFSWDGLNQIAFKFSEDSDDVVLISCRYFKEKPFFCILNWRISPEISSLSATSYFLAGTGLTNSRGF